MQKGLNKMLLSMSASIAVLGFSMVAAAPAFAQDAAPLDEEPDIIVTARQRSETLQQVPVTVTTVGGEQLGRYNVTRIDGVINRVPTLDVQTGGSGSGGQLSLRGVGSSNISAAFDSAVSVNIDGVQISTSRIVQAGFFDVRQVEVLKGPQSLFFGKSASAGVVSLTSADPTSSWQTSINGSYEFEERAYQFDGFISGPLTDTLGIRVAALYSDASRFVQLQAGTPAANQNRGLRDFIGRLTLDWEPTSNFHTNLKVQYNRNENDGAAGNIDIFCGANGVADPIFLLQGAVVIPAGYNCNVGDNPFLPDTAAALSSNPPAGTAARGRNGVPFGQTDLWFARLRSDLELTPSLRLTSITGYANLNANDYENYSYGGVGPAFSPLTTIFSAPFAAFAPALAANNRAGAPLGSGSNDTVNQLQQFTQELRLASNFDGPLNFMLGAFYERRHYVFRTSQNGLDISFISPDPVTGFTSDYLKNHDTVTDAVSVFGSGTWAITPELELSGGLRFTQENKQQRISVPYVHALLSGNGSFVSSGFFAGPINFSDSNLSGEVSIRYTVAPDINVYGSYRTGFKSGGIDNSALPTAGLNGLNSSNTAVRQAAANNLTFDSETTSGGEVGIKAQFDDRAVTLNLSAYYYVFKNLQVQNFDAVNIQFITLNAGELTSQGLDLTWNWRTPINGLRLSGAAAYTDARYSAPFVTGAGVDLNGRAAPHAPRWAGNIAADLTVPLGSAVELGLNGNAAYSSSYFTYQETLTDYVQRSYVTFDGTVSIGSPEGRWRVSLVGNNITDQRIVSTSGPRPYLAPPGPAGLGLPAGDDVGLSLNRGRQIFVRTSFRF